MKFISDSDIKIDRELSDLDRFALSFIKILRNHTDYVIVSGYVSIILGRARASEDIDVIIAPIDKNKLGNLVGSLKKTFYCLNANDANGIYGNLKETALYTRSF